MTFEPKKFNQVFEEMRQRTAIPTDFEVGSVTRTVYESFAYEIALLYEKMKLVYLSAYVDTAEGQQLDMVVAILGIKRGEPEFAEGIIAFERDLGKQDIEVPLGTLVATPETPTNPKKVYQTIESKLFPKEQTSLEVKIQAVNRGETQVTPAETLTVLPRPIPGIKAVSNADATRFTGKRRETDEELRERAKNTLISSGKATILSLENALLSLPGVKDVKVRENFRFARGEVTLTRPAGTNLPKITIAKGTQLTAAAKGFKTTNQVVLAATNRTVDVPVQSMIEGQAGEVAANASWNPINTLSVSNPNPIQLGQFGLIEIYVDGVDFQDEKAVAVLEKEIEQVKAAGIFARLKSAIAVTVDGVFKIEINQDLQLSQEERLKLEQAVQNEIDDYIKERKMGQPLLFSQIIKNVLCLDGISNLDEFILTTSKQRQDEIIQKDQYNATDKRIEIDEFERFIPGNLCVASEIKLLPVTIELQVANLDQQKEEELVNALSEYFKNQAIGSTIVKSEIITAIASVSGIGENTLKLAPQPWYQKTEAQTEEVTASFVEQPVLGEVFAYSNKLNLQGTITITLPASLREKEKQNVSSQVKDKLVNYVATLKPGADVVFADLKVIAAGVKPVILVGFNPGDFQVTLEGTSLPDRILPKQVKVGTFEKVELEIKVEVIDSATLSRRIGG
ncbi:baseplate J/gp47 family protein [Microcystis aeruginosa BLCCF158]|uniref:Baseplate J/gp47 family protein n=1 Tax=Microcystis aeruginosa BLCC-F158 TaxID=2755316 RepID=A0A841V0L0_MICAE|nr:baseplate J/gp47 family protein [Microcystis aeruginosa]MBC1195765.1 baseplate J/gp47 family protein [Microcystis aeruginosa BLCC-F158]